MLRAIGTLQRTKDVGATIRAGSGAVRGPCEEHIVRAVEFSTGNGAVLELGARLLGSKLHRELALLNSSWRPVPVLGC